MRRCAKVQNRTIDHHGEKRRATGLSEGIAGILWCGLVQRWCALGEVFRRAARLGQGYNGPHETRPTAIPSSEKRPRRPAPLPGPPAKASTATQCEAVSCSSCGRAPLQMLSAGRAPDLCFSPAQLPPLANHGGPGYRPTLGAAHGGFPTAPTGKERLAAFSGRGGLHPYTVPPVEGPPGSHPAGEADGLPRPPPV